MPRVNSENIIAAPLEDVWKMAQDVEQMPSFMPDLVSVKILEDERTSPVTRRTVTEWMGRIKQFNRNVHWVEEDIWNEEEKVCHFWQIRGDYTDYRGTWKFVPQGGSTPHATRALLEIEYVIDIPLLGALMQKIVKKLMQENCDTMLSCLKNQAEK